MEHPICARPGCGRPLPKGRRKWCSDECWRASRWNKEASRRVYTKKLDAEAAARLRPRACPKMVRCLRCSTDGHDVMFVSEGPWNRICPNCKKNDSNRDTNEPIRHGVPPDVMAGLRNA